MRKESAIVQIDNALLRAKGDYEEIVKILGSFGDSDNPKQEGNLLYKGDNLSLLTKLRGEEKFAMIYIDPPFFTGADKDANMNRDGDLVRETAYKDSWGTLEEYLHAMALRLMLMRDLMRDDGLFFLHVDWHAVHYMRLLMDEIFGEDSTRQVSLQNLLAGFISGASGKNCLMTADEAAQTMQTMMQTVKARVMAEKFGDWKKECEDYMAKIAKKEGIKELGDGVYYEVITEGTGAVPADTNKVSVNYEGKLLNDTIFDSSYQRGEPAKFRCDQVIPGWTKALTNMPVGSTWMVYIPQEQAYGEREAGKISPFSCLIFKIELLGIEK